ncbi:MAG: FAD-dependent oxidoreductase [Chlamydiales bacterium]
MSFDCVVIGAGILGVTIARQLALQFPNRSALLLDQSLAGGGASRFSAGLHIPYGYNSTVKRLSAMSAEVYAKSRQKSAHFPIYPLLMTGIVKAEKYPEISSRFYQLGLGVLSNNLVPKSIGTVKLEDADLLFPISDAHYANVGGIIHHYLEEIRLSQTTKLWEGVAVSEISCQKNTVAISLADGRRIESQKVILAPGPWVKKNSLNGILDHLPIRTKKIVALHIDRKPEPNDPGLFLFDLDAFLLPLHHLGYWLFSFTCQEWEVLPDPTTLAIRPEDRDLALSILWKYFPDLAPHANSGRVFCDAYSNDRVPIIAKLPINPNIVFIGATNGSGYRLAPGIAIEGILL